jgi:hypothetical protein
METRYLIFRSCTGLVHVEALDQFRLERKFHPEEIERLDRGLPVEDPLGVWADMCAVTLEMMEHWESTP